MSLSRGYRITFGELWGLIIKKRKSECSTETCDTCSESKLSLLILSLPYSPNAVVGAKRFSFLNEQFEAQGHNVCVVTLSKKHIDEHDVTIPRKGIILEVGSFPSCKKRQGVVSHLCTKIWNRVCPVDQYSGWVIPSILKALYAGMKQKFTHLIITGPPFSPFLAGPFLKYLLRVKLVLDYRDPWTSHRMELRPGFMGEKLLMSIEKHLLKHADLVVASTETIRRGLIRVFDVLKENKCITVTNGFNGSLRPVRKSFDARKIVMYAGNLYGDRKLVYLARPLSKLIRDGEIMLGSVVIMLMGKLPEEQRIELESEGLLSLVEERPRVSYSEALNIIASSDILYLPTGNDYDYSLPFKFFDYLCARRQILAVGAHDSEICVTMAHLDCGVFCLNNDIKAISEALLLMLRNDVFFTFKGNEIFMWSCLARKYSAALQLTI